jgi:hypothetical protein
MRADIQPEIDLARPSEKWPSPKRSGLDENTSLEEPIATVLGSPEGIRTPDLFLEREAP